MPNQIIWADIPVANLDRAIRFYSAVLGVQLEKTEYPGMAIGLFPHKEGEASGCLFVSAKMKPSAEGVLVYLNVHGRLDEALEAVAASGGKILEPKEAIRPFGFRAVMLDSEGNRVALHSP